MTEFVSRLWNVILHSTAHLTTGELILRTSLICCSIFAMIQLLSMLATHYGDRNCTSKSLFLSLLLHCCFGLGWATVVDNMPRSSADPESPQQAIKVTMSHGTDSTTEHGMSLHTTWNSSQPLDAELTRMQRRETERETPEMPSLEKTPTVDPVVPVAPDLKSQPDEAAPAPSQSIASNASAAPARPTSELDQLVLQARPESRSVETVSRQQMTREVSSADLATRVEPQRGAAQRTAPLIEDGAVLTLPSELMTETATPKPVGVPDEFIRRRSNPDPVAADTAVAGSSPSSTAAINTGDRRTGKFTRAGNRTVVDADSDLGPVKSNPTAGSATREQMFASTVSIPSEGLGQSPTPQQVRPDSSPVARTPTRDPEPYKARRLDQRKAIALKNGGSEESERAVEASLRWMASVQELDGSWSSSRHGGGAAKKDPQGQNRLDGGMFADSGITGLVVLSYLGAGYTHEKGKYSEVVMRAVKWLIAQQNSNGYLGGKATRYDMMYCHAMATFALAEAYGMQGDPESFPELRDAVRNAVRLICAMQNEDGGWRYGKGGDSDMSMFGWQLMALKSALNAGIPVPDETRRGMIKFLQGRALGNRGGLAGYKLNESPTPAMTAEALFCRQMFGVRPRDGASQEAIAYLRQNLPRLAAYDEYYWYYGTLAMFQTDGAPWEEWNGALRDMLIGQQRTSGPLAGSWDPNGKWAGIGGRVYSTAVSTMCLEVYYRVLRIYQTSDE